MLIEFSVKNFLSFREKQTFSMVAAPRLQKRENTFAPDLAGEKFPRLLKVAAIYGPNASGKSNLLAAMLCIGVIAGREPEAEPPPLPVKPFRFDGQLSNDPSEFEVHFIKNRLRYHFTLAATGERIIRESLTAYPGGKEKLLYDRRYDGHRDIYRLGELEGEAALHSLWQQLTGPKTLFISRAAANSNTELQQLSEPFIWLRRGLFSLGSDLSMFIKASQAIARQKASYNGDVSNFLRSLDIPVKQIRFEGGDEEFDFSTIQKMTKSLSHEVKTTLTHTTRLGDADFDLSEESDGTRSLIGFYLPWRVMKAAPSEAVFSALLVDELDRSLHPEIVRSLIEQHIKSDNPAQLIFTTHDTHLMDTKLLRRDQFWLTERDHNGATLLSSIHEFEGRDSEDIEKRYFAGRYRSLPIISRD
ncbi:AAA family ATPase [Herbaspirillum rubrisubalbicans]|uniref:ATP-binding protein n=1 Tax=Herbaspirillum rubrisubalbicans TaxID=80842 RepID=A0AAD0XJN3_9BURK|nr:ATP-binding protein [Herbaspirillum rubrisubalbicans]AYR27079.1 ATP-binding protein [Herbaspirillum rubrisubalbicans]